MKSKKNEPEPIQVAAALLFKGGKLLITQRRPGDYLGGLWEFPGGKLEGAETFQECLARELREELGLEVRVLEEVDDLTHAYPEKSVRLKFFRCAWRAGEARPVGCQALAWVTPSELPCYRFPAADARLLHLLNSAEHLWAQP